jgi:hypothetical protein
MPLYNRGKALNKDFTAGTWRWILLTSAYVPNPDHDFVSDVVANEASGSGYARQNVAGQAITIDDANDRADHDATNPTFGPMTSAFRYLGLYKFGTNDADSELHSYYDVGAQSITAASYMALLNGGAASGTAFRGT